MPCNPSQHVLPNRHDFLVAGGLSFSGLLAQNAFGAPLTEQRRRTANSTILIWLMGGASHIDTWDLKTRAPIEYRGDFNPIQTSAADIELCEHLPLLAKQAHHVAVVRSVGHVNSPQNDHHTGYYYNLTGHCPEPGFNNSRQPEPTDWPFMGSVVASGRTPHPYLPHCISLPDKAGLPGGRRPGQFAARLGVQHDPMYIYGGFDRPMDFQAPSLGLPADISIEHVKNRHRLLKSLDRAERELDHSRSVHNFSTLQEQAFSLINSKESRDAFDLTNEPTSVRERYGTSLNAMGLLLARRLVEAGVSFVTVFFQYDPMLNRCSGGSWDTHWQNFKCLREYLLPDFDRSYSALLADLDERGLLDETMVIVNSEMGRKPKIGDPRSNGVTGQGRDHWTHCMSVLLAGGGIQGGQVYGSSDRVGAYPEDKPVTPAHITKTVYRAAGVHNMEATDAEGRRFPLLQDGYSLDELF